MQLEAFGEVENRRNLDCSFRREVGRSVREADIFNKYLPTCDQSVEAVLEPQIPPSTLPLSGSFRMRCLRKTCPEGLALISYRQVPRLLAMLPLAPSPLALRRCSRYLPVVRRFALADTASRCNGVSLDYCALGCLWLSSVGMLYPLHPSMPRHRNARGMQSSFAFPIGGRHSDLARPKLSRSCPISALAVTRPDHALHPFCRYGDGSNHQRSFFLCTSGFPADPSRNRISAPITGAGLHPFFQVDPVAAHPGAILSQADKAFEACDRLARRGDSSLDRSTGLVGLMTIAKADGRLNSTYLECLRIAHGGIDPPRSKNITFQAVLPTSWQTSS